MERKETKWGRKTVRRTVVKIRGGGGGGSFAYLLHYSEGTRRNTLYLAPVRRALPFSSDADGSANAEAE